MMHNSNKQAGNTYAIILIVLALIGLWAIAQPKFITSCKRGPVAIAYSDMRTLTTGIEAYLMDEYNKGFPPNLYCITTPVPYLMQSIPTSPYGENAEYSYYYEESDTANTPSLYLLWCTGPDEKNDLTKTLLSQRIKQERERVGNKISKDSITMFLYDLTYDASNGMQSSGDVFHISVNTVYSPQHANRNR